VGEAVQAVAVRHDALSRSTSLSTARTCSGRKFVVIEKRNEFARDGPLEVNVVFPQGVVGVDEEGLERQALGSLALRLLRIAWQALTLSADLGRDDSSTEFRYVEPLDLSGACLGENKGVKAKS
jgi:hypothetical protein